MAADTSDTARLESILLRAGERHAHILRMALSRFPRPLGSEKVPLNDQKVEWGLLRENPQVLQQFFAEQNASLESAIAYAEKMERG